MGDGMAVSMLWLLAILVGLNIATGFVLVRYLTEIVLALHTLNRQVQDWRKWSGRTFQYIEDDTDIWGEDDEQEAHSGR